MDAKAQNNSPLPDKKKKKKNNKKRQSNAAADSPAKTDGAKKEGASTPQRVSRRASLQADPSHQLFVDGTGAGDVKVRAPRCVTRAPPADHPRTAGLPRWCRWL